MEAIEELFYQFVKRLAWLKETEYEEVFMDGTKLKNVANRYTFVWKSGVEKNLEKLKEKAKSVFHEYGRKVNLTRGKLRELAVNSEYITGVAAFSNRTNSGTLIPFLLDHIQRMQGQSYRDIVADAGYESVNNYLYLE